MNNVSRKPCIIEIYIVYQSVCPFVEIGSPQPLPFKWVCLLPWTQMGGATLTFGWGCEGTQFGRLGRKPGTLYTWCPAYFSLRKRSSGPLDHERSNERGHLFFSQPLRNSWEKTLIYSCAPQCKRWCFMFVRVFYKEFKLECPMLLYLFVNLG